MSKCTCVKLTTTGDTTLHTVIFSPPCKGVLEFGIDGAKDFWSEGNLLLLAKQDRSRWDHNLIQLGFHHLDKAARGDELTEYRLQAGIAACHAVAPSHAATNWQQILLYYDEKNR